MTPSKSSLLSSRIVPEGSVSEVFGLTCVGSPARVAAGLVEQKLHVPEEAPLLDVRSNLELLQHPPGRFEFRGEGQRVTGDEGDGPETDEQHAIALVPCSVDDVTRRHVLGLEELLQLRDELLVRLDVLWGVRAGIPLLAVTWNRMSVLIISLSESLLMRSWAIWVIMAFCSGKLFRHLSRSGRC